eukprot:scaffold61962_cov38-Prasinocladus_malaysianus.AAC.1
MSCWIEATGITMSSIAYGDNGAKVKTVDSGKVYIPPDDFQHVASMSTWICDCRGTWKKTYLLIKFCSLCHPAASKDETVFFCENAP